METIRRPLVSSSMVALSFAVLTLGALVCTRYLDSSAFALIKPFLTDHESPSETDHQQQHTPKTPEIPVINCSLITSNTSQTCSFSQSQYNKAKAPVQHRSFFSSPSSDKSNPTCPDYFHYIYEDLWPWRETGITKEMVMKASPLANFRLVILNGKAYVETYRKSFQTRDMFTLWGILQLLRRYPAGKIPDLDMMFNCNDHPVVEKRLYANNNNNNNPGKKQVPPPLFKYCSDDLSYDIVFPDWSFWGWSELNIKPWEPLCEDLEEGNKRTQWAEREPYAYWKGNPHVAETRMDLLTCNVSDKHDWNARVYIQNWSREEKEGFKESNLASQCVHRYKIYIEGAAWSVSEKYILACDSMTLLVKPRYFDFFTRSLIPLKHYWPIKDRDKCRSLKYAVEWGNSHQQEAQAIGKSASDFIQNELKMDHIYDYMFHLMSEYAKLLTYKPTIPKKAVELCVEEMFCSARGLEKKFMVDSMVKGPQSSGPCAVPPPYSPASLHSVLERKNSAIKQVDAWENEYWNGHK